MHLSAIYRHVVLLLIALISFGLYIGTLSNDFVWDDKYEILNNYWIRDFTYLPDILFSHSLGWLRPEQSSTKYAPLKLLVRLFQYQISGADPWTYQLTNIFMHVMSSIMIFFVSARLLADFHGETSGVFPFVASLLFAVHPIHTEPVNWAIGLSELSMSFFCLLSFYLFMKAYGKNSKAHILPGFFLFIALLFKVTAVVFILVFIVYDYAMKKRGAAAELNARIQWKILIGRYLPVVLAVVGFFSLFLFVISGESEPVRTNHIRLDTFHLLLNVPLLFYQYMEKLILPVQLNVLYVFHPVNGLTELRFYLPLCFLLIIIYLVILTLKKDVMLSLCSVLIIAPLLPCLYLPATGYSYYVFAERYLYLPSAGYVIAVSLLLRTAAERWMHNKFIVYLITLLFVMTAISFAVLTVQRNHAWKDDYSLWLDTAEKSPDSDVAHNNLGAAYEQKGLLDEALHQYDTAIALNPAYMDAYENRFRAIKKKTFLSGAR